MLIGRNALVKKIILISLGVCVLIIGGLTAYISVMDWNSYKEELAGKFSEIIGKKIEFSGDIEVSLFPHTQMSAKNITVLNPNNSQKLAAIEKMDMAVSLSSLLDGKPDVQSLALVGAEIWLEFDENGVYNWKSTNNNTFSDTDMTTRLQSLSLQGALVHYENKKQKISFDLTQFNADIQAETLSGPFRLDGNFIKDNDHFGTAISIGDISQLDEVSTNFAITHPKSESFLRFDGAYKKSNGGFRGDFSGEAKKTASFVNILSGKEVLASEYDVPLMFSVNVESDAIDLKLSSFVVRFGEFFEGSGNMIIPLDVSDETRKTAEIKYQLVNLDMRPILALFKTRYDSFKENGSVYEPNTIRDVLFDVSAERVVVADTSTGYFENLSIRGDWKSNALNIEDFYAACPGNIVLSLSGSLVEENKVPNYYVKVNLDGQNFNSFMEAFDINITPAVQSAYRNINFNITLSGTDKELQTTELKLLMDKMNIDGGAKIQFGEAENNYEINLEADKVNLDNYVQKNDENISILDSLKADFSRLAFLKDKKIKATMFAENLIFRSVPFEKVRIDMENEASSLILSNLDISNVMDTGLNVVAVIDGIGSEDPIISDMNYNVKSNDFLSVINRLQIDLPKWDIFNAKKVLSSGKIKGNLKSVELDTQSTIDAVRFDYKGKVSKDEIVNFDGFVDLKTTNFGKFMQSLGSSLQNNINNNSALNCLGTIKGNIEDWSFNQAKCLIGVASYEGDIAVKHSKSNHTINAVLNVNDLNLKNLLDMQATKSNNEVAENQNDTFLTRPNFNRNTFNFDIYRNINLDVKLKAEKSSFDNNEFNNLNVHILNSANIMKLNGLSFNMKDTEIKGNVEINYAKNPEIKGKLDALNISLENFGGKTYAFNSGTLNLNSEFSTIASSIEDFVSNVSGTLKFNIKNADIKGLNLLKIASDLEQRQYSKGVFQAVRDNLESGNTVFDSFDGNIEMNNGVLTFENTNLINKKENIKMNGKINLSEWKMDNNFVVNFVELKEIPPFTFTLSGLLNKPSLDIDVKDVAEKYDAHWEEIAEIEQAKKDEELRKLNDKMTEVQTEVEKLSNALNSQVPVIEGYLQKTKNETVKARYKSKLERVDLINKEINLMKSKANLTDFTESDVKKIHDACVSYMQEIEKMKPEIAKYYEDDVHSRFEETAETAKKIHADNEAVFENYQFMVQDAFDALLKINSTQYMVNNTVLKNQQRDVANYNDELIEKYDYFVAKYDKDAKITNLEEIEIAIIDLQQKISEMSEILDKMNDLRNASAELLDKIITEQQIAYEEELRLLEEEKKRKAKENEGNLLAKGDEEEINDTDVKSAPQENLTNLISKKADDVPFIAPMDNKPKLLQPITDTTSSTSKPMIKVKPAGLNKNNTTNKSSEKTSGILKAISDNMPVSKTVAGSISKSYDDEIKKGNTTGNNILKEVTGDIQKTSGTITVK